MRIAVLGAGALGTLLAGLLKEGGHDLVLLGRSPRLNEMQGVRILRKGKERFIPLQVTTSADEIKDAEVILLTVKSYDTFGAINGVKDKIPKSPPIVSLQNGLGNYEIISDILGKDRVLLGVTYQASTLLTEGSAGHTAEGETLIGSLDTSEKAQWLVNKLEDAIKIRTVPDILSYMWGKLIINSAINPITTLTQRKNGEILDSEDLVHLVKMVCDEGLAIAKAIGIKPYPPDSFEACLRVARSTAKNTSSMLQDIMRSKKTEIDQINGAIVSLGEKVSVAAPVNSALYALVKGVEAQSFTLHR